MTVVTSGAALGTASDGVIRGVRISSGQILPMIYDSAQGVWVGPSTLTMRSLQNEGIASGGAPSAWRYPASTPEAPTTRTWPWPAGFHIHKVMNGGQFYAAGLRLQEHLTGEIFTTDLTGTTVELPQVALSWYPLATADGFLSPAPFNHGVRLTGTRSNTEYRFASTGWQNTPAFDTPPTSSQHLYPEIYMTGPLFNLRGFTARHRWVYGNVGSGSGEQASKYPMDSLVGWFEADNIPVADGQPVAEWPNYAGRTGILLQATGTKQPVVNTSGGRRSVTFDGTNDIMRAAVPATPLPVTVFLVMRQRASGGTQQVWMGQNGASAPLLYRFDATDQVSVWTGGSDFTYHRSSAWPSPWMIWSVVMTSGAADIWENLTQVASGAAGSTGFNGFTLGNNDGETLPAAIDVAAVIVSYKAATNTERTNVVNYLNSKYSVF